MIARVYPNIADLQEKNHMPSLSFLELRRGLCVFLDIKVILSRRTAYCNARCAESAVNRNGPFMLLKPVGGNRWLMAPLFSNGTGSDRVKLFTPYKTGPGRRWREEETFLSRHQFWIMDADAIVAASHLDNNTYGSRQRYANDVPDAISELIGYASDNTRKFRLMWSDPPEDTFIGRRAGISERTA